ncbi:murein hydrolase activator NlpD [Xenorhabdus griffiniae]|uniref:Murein hydrolase activator NlpD n=1 Tax=Xenorhabdus griffiniae TaxID=351672 RepID=A0ABY9XJT1_9GAMM|nr:murein hydrolase activator NlpD [Xenorhabdus griffiniae]MBD1227607.1 murein hydrolase activator NlpD [Xenorhabdus griffiniae]MBE8587832.1 murein hydrolase activator NlpD [Xenorhabdus griffiniae]WMV73173.1 murein hydrolase activator NlpD [Xenorhabdus griffiniae]WNH02852.1 murein hydrolase activator NlpD [Xenorhabdus griffiniae]
MNLEKPVKKIKWIIASTVMGVVLIGCSNTPNRPAPIVNIDTNRVSDNHAIKNRQLANNASSSQGLIIYRRNYENIPKGSYNGSTYTVKHGDTLFYIAWITGGDFRDLALRNNISEPYSLNVGQVLRIGNPTSKNSVLIASNSTKSKISQVDFQKINAYPAIIDKPKSEKMLPKATISDGDNSSPKVSIATGTGGNNATNGTDTINSWRWPAEGKILESFSDSQGGNKGIDIAGNRGQPVFATARGKVVYAGNALRGYGNLIIIKHNDDYLSAYAHNDTMLVREQQDVQAGQKIATMGSTGTSSVRLHFEIRYKGKSVNPLRYLPQR